MSEAIIQGPEDGTGKRFYVLKVPNITIPGVGTVDVFVPTTAQAGFWTYQAVANNSACAASKNHLVLFNGTGSGKKVKIQEIFTYPHLTANVAGANITLQVIGVGQEGTGGSVGVIRKHDTSDPNLPAEIVSRLGATSLTIPADREVGGAVVNIEESAQIGEGRYSLYQKVGNQSELILNENQGVVVKQTAQAGVGNISVHIVFTTN
jgi:hypothetical protein